MTRKSHLFMVRPDLASLWSPCLPGGCTLRTYEPGDETAWLHIVRESLDATAGDDAFERRVRSDEEFLPERVFFALCRDRAVATASAFRKLAHGERTGYVHMLAVRPAFRGRGLGGAVLEACLHYFLEQGWNDAVLDTESTRTSAIRLYLAHGFQPFPETPQELDLWREVLVAEGRRDLAGRLRLRAGPNE